MAKVFLWINFLLLLLAVSSTAVEGDQPTYTDCRPHIDATIRDLAAKAVQAGEEPSDPDSLDYGETQPADPSPESEPEPSSEEDSEPVVESVEDQSEEDDDEDDLPEKPFIIEKSSESTKQDGKKVSDQSSKKKSEHKEKKKEKHQKKKHSKPSPKKEVKQESRKSEKSKSPEKKTDNKESRHKHYERSASRSESPVRRQSPKQKSPAQGQKMKMGIFDKFIDVVFGMPTEPRNPKFAKPWMTHPEFAKTESAESKKTSAKKAVSKEPGLISKSINKIVGSIFGLPSYVKREKKWAKPWQTHQEHSKREEKSQSPEKKKVVPHKPMFTLNFINKFVEMVFGKVTTKRDPKFAKPWQTHPEFASDPKPAGKKTETKPKSKPKIDVHSQGGIINSLITLVFDAPTGKRDPKFAKPWNTHEEHKPKEQAQKKTGAVAQPKKVSTESGLISSSINKMIYSLFGKPTEPRSKKWKQPWNTHPEHQHTGESQPTKKVEKKTSTESGFIGQMINKAVVLIFGPVPDKRDAKWVKPWTQIKEEEDRAKAKLRKGYHPKEKSPPARKAERSPTPEPKTKSKSIPPPKPAPKEKSPSVPKKVSPQRTHSPSPSPPARSPSPSPPPKKEPKSEPPRPAPKQAHPREESPATVQKPRESPKPVEAPRRSETPVKKVVKEKEKRKVEEEDDSEEEVAPSLVRGRDHINSILGLDGAGGYVTKKSDAIAGEILKDLKKIHESAIKPLEKSFKYHDISNRQLSDAEVFGTPHVLLLGPYSTGKSSFINYLLGTENTRRALKTGTPPSHGVFRIIQYGEHDRELDGTDVGGQWSFTSLQKFGQNFVDQIKGVALNVPLLKKVTFIEAPGVLEMRRPNERLYPFNDVLQWFIDRADLILIMFDYTKLDAGFEMEAILDQLKGREAQARILLNKADQVPPEELIKVQGSLFWNLSPLLGINSPPVVYAGSFASLPYRQSSPVKLFQAQEEALLHDIAKAISSRVENRVAIARRHAVRVRNHAQMVDSYLTTFRKNKGFLTSKHKLAEDIIENPHDYNIYEGISLQTNVSRYDLPDAEIYRDFFRVHNLYDFRTLKETCGFLGGCPMEKLDAAISTQLPQLITKYRRQLEGAGSSSKPPSFKTSADARGAHSQASHS